VDVFAFAMLAYAATRTALFAGLDGLAVGRRIERGELVFYNATRVIDLAYAGFFEWNDLATVGKLVADARPDYITVDF
jgi:uncharacterized RDD family membrane protein YckC